MISIKEALTIKDGHIIHDYFGRMLRVNNYSITYDKGSPADVEFGCRDIYTNESFVYSYDEIYLEFNDLSDENKLFLTWLRKKNNCIYLEIEDIQSMKEAFMSGFTEGYSYRKQINAEEQLQK
jgi:hypothetical protein